MGGVGKGVIPVAGFPTPIIVGGVPEISIAGGFPVGGFAGVRSVRYENCSYILIYIYYNFHCT